MSGAGRRRVRVAGLPPADLRYWIMASCLGVCIDLPVGRRGNRDRPLVAGSQQYIIGGGSIEAVVCNTTVRSPLPTAVSCAGIRVVDVIGMG